MNASSGLAMLSLAIVGCTLYGNAQLDVAKPLHLTHVEGYVVNSHGKPVVNTEVTLVRGEKVAYRTRSDNSGAFHFDHVSGSFMFRVARSENAPAVREVSVEPEILTALQRKKLYVICGARSLHG